MKRSINTDIAFTHIITRKRQTLVAALGVTLGVGIFLFMNSLTSGFSSFSTDEMFKNSAHIKIYKDDELSQPLMPFPDSRHVAVIVNPQITTLSKKIINPEQLLSRIKKQPYVVNAIAQVGFDAFYNRGKAQLRGDGNGVNILEYDAMFKTGKYIVAGSLNGVQGNLNGIIIGSGIAEKLNLGINDNITVTSSYNVVKVMKIAGIFTTGNSITDNAKSYMNITTAQQFIKEGPSYVSNIFINVPDPNESEKYAVMLQQLTPYKVEDWKTTNADVLASGKTRDILMSAISLSILVVAAFGIYNILSSTIAQKINDIAILKATGFAGKDVVRIFLSEALIMGFIGTLMGLVVGGVLIAIMSRIYMGGPVGYFPIRFEPGLFAKSFGLGLFITLCAGYFPARKAARVDPVEIFRK
ncbi:FtsX-like permease family protein [Mucilaginibacter sp. OK283]|uniref:ABC transporter permease n=1 Tax=Mucilaginibacter sp. OK283 TaxID=1881049 RepID=UPI0008B0A8B9|nr:FtsX-like permease family protein [Mucilaginibacter sp. OK283]SEP40421.1 lipoprotein-releasing system permease protein [Mucilaginibacter sp. OK283]